MSMTRGAKMLMVRNETNRGNQTNREYGRMETPEMNYEMRYDGGSGGDMRRGGYGGRNEYEEMNYPRNDYGGMNYGESRFRDRRGREHYDNGRFAPMNEMRGDEMRGIYPDMRRDYGMRGEDAEMGGYSHYPFGPVPPVYEREPGMNRIGFAARDDIGTGRSDAGYHHPNEMEYKKSEAMRGGASGETMMLTEDMAHEWMHGLHNEDGTSGPHWNMDQVKQVMNQRGVKHNPIEFWAILNAMYSDYCGVFKKHGCSNMDVYVDMAKAWLDDKDAKEGKAARYFQYIVK